MLSAGIKMLMKSALLKPLKLWKK